MLVGWGRGGGDRSSIFRILFAISSSLFDFRHYGSTLRWGSVCVGGGGGELEVKI